MIYIASPFFNPEQISVVVAIEKKLEENGLAYFSPRSEGTLGEMTEEERQQSKHDVYTSNINHIEDCQEMIAVIDGRDVGTIWEMGYATALGKRIVSYSNEGFGLNVMLAESVQCHTTTLADMLSALLSPDFMSPSMKGVY